MYFVCQKKMEFYGIEQIDIQFLLLSGLCSSIILSHVIKNVFMNNKGADSCNLIIV